MSYAICRIIKLKKSNLAGSDTHVSRTRPTLNANPSITPQNKSLIFTDDRSPLQDLVAAKIALTHQGAVRSNAVHAVELLLSASPGYFRPNKPTEYGAYDPVQVDAWAQHNIEWLKQEYGDRIVRAILHLDEATPHIHAYLVPIDAKGQLNCRGIFGERKNMFALQDSYAAAMAPLELERGKKGSKAEHTSVREYYTAVNEYVDGGMAAVIGAMTAETVELKQQIATLTGERDDWHQKYDELATGLRQRDESAVTTPKFEDFELVSIKPARHPTITNRTPRSPISDGNPVNHIPRILAVALKNEPTTTPPEIVTPLSTVTLPEIENVEVVTIESVVTAVPLQQPKLRELVKNPATKTASPPQDKHHDPRGR